eukprot:g11145.t1
MKGDFVGAAGNVRPTVRGIIPSLAVAFWYLIRGGTAQYDSCNGTVADIGDGRCDPVLNTPYCGWDGGDCCNCTCSDGPVHACSDSVFDCLYPYCGDSAPTVSGESHCVELWISDGECDDVNNVGSCDYDGGDCCQCGCLGARCVAEDFDCLDPAAGDELYDCKAPPPAALPCSADVQRTWVVENSIQSRDLAAAVNCSGGSFEVEWRGRIAVNEAIYVVDGTILTVSGVEPDAVMDGNGSQRLFTVINAALHVSGVNITSGAGAAGGAIAASGASLTLNRTSLTGNSATGNGGAVYVTDGTSLSCVDVSFVGNRADISGGAVYVTGGSVVSCGGSWLNNTAGGYGGALGVSNGSTASWEEDAIFSQNTAGLDGGGLAVYNSSSVSWSAPSTFSANSATASGGALVIFRSSSASWNTTTLFDSNDCGGWGGGIAVVNSNASWTGEAHSVFLENKARYGGAVALHGARLFSTENTATSFTRSVATKWGGAIDVFRSSAVFGGSVWSDRCRATGEPDDFQSGFGGAFVVALGSNVSWHRDLRFTENSAEKVAGALYVSDSTVSWSSSTHFTGNNAGLSGGALFLWNGSYVEWTGDTDFSSNDAGADGGAVGCPVFDSEYNFFSSTLVVNGSTAFVNNTSRASGGALALSEALSVSILASNVSFVDNAAEVAGGAVYVSGAGVGPLFTGVSFVSNVAQVGGAVSTVGSGNLKGFGDVESPNPTTYDRCRFIRNRATATGGGIESASGQDFIFNSEFEGNRAVAGGALRLAGAAAVENCTFSDNASDDGGGAAVSNIGSLSWMTNISFISNIFYCEPDMFLGFEPGHPYEAVCSGCQTLCDECFFEEPDLVPACEGAMDHSNSSGGTVTLETLSIEPGYWRATASSTDVLACYNADACLGGVTGTDGYCLEGYEGPYCSVCSNGYTAQLGYTCDKCSDSTGGVVIIVVAVIVAVAGGLAVAVYVMSGEVGRTRRGRLFGRLFRNIPLQSVKIVIVAWQILTQRFLDALDVFNFDLTWILSAGCLVDVDFHDRLLVSTMSPLVALVFMAGTYAAAATFHRGVPETLQVVWNRHVSLVLLLTFLVYSSVSAALFQTFACEPLADNNIYLRADYSIQCDSPKHEAFMVYAGIMMVLYTVGIPVFYGYLLFRDRDVLAKHEADRVDSPRVTTTSDLWKPYKPSVFYYEVIECSRRVLLTGVVVFIEPNTSAQIAVTLMMAFVFVVISEALAPYASRWDAWLSRMGHAVVFVSMYVALLLKVDVSDERAGSQRVFEVVLVAAQHDNCNGVVANIGDGRCDAALNTLGCGWDGGDAGDELYDCQIPPPSPLPCSADAQRAWLVDSSAQAHALAAAVNCSGGSFEVEWKGHIAVDEAIYVVDGTVLIVTGGSSTAVVDGNGSTRLFTVVNATLHVSGVNITTGAGAAGGAIAASRASLTLNRTSLTGNRSAGKGGAVYLSGGSTMACSDVSFVSNSADVGGAVYVADHSVVSCGGSWLKNTAVRNGGALSVGEGSSVSWEEEATFARNTAGMFGGALIVSDRSSVFWSAPSSFFSNRAVTGGGGGGYVNFGSSVSWNATTRFDSNDGGGGGGGLGVDGESNVFWAGPTTYVNNSAEIGGALVVVNSTVSWTGEVHSLFDGNNARLGGALEIEYSSHLSCTENTKSSFTNNWATTAGGALFVDSMSSVFFGGDVWFHRNIASSELRELESGVGGAVFVDVGSSVAWHRDARFTENSADKIGGALYLSQSSISWSSSTHFAENHAGISGGALFLWNGSLVEWTGDTTFASNEAAADGGAVASPGFDPEFNLQSSRLLMNGPTTFVNNTSGANGGALSSLGALSVLIMGENVDFSGNSARDAGGAVYVSATGLGPVFAGMRFLSNSAQVGGAASIVASGNLKRVEDVESPNPTTFDRCIFIDNTATATGGAIESAAGQDLIMNSVFEGNRAGAGGALRLAGMASVDNCSFVDNVSDDGEGAAVSNIGSISKMTTISFRGNAFFCRPDMFLDFHRLLDALDVFNFDLTWILSAGCVVDADFHDRLLVSTITPLAALFFMAGTYTAATAIHQGAPEALQVIWNKHVSLVLLLTFLIYSSVTSSLFKTFACEPLKDGNVYLRADYSIQCDSPKHEAFEMYAGAMMVPYTAGIPALYGYLLFRDRDVLAKNEAEREDVPRVTTISDLWKPYKPSVFYYEIIECSRRVLLTGVVVFIEPNTSAQIAVTLMMAFVFEALAPYASMWDAWLSRMGHAVVFVSMYVALLLKVDVSDEPATDELHDCKAAPSTPPPCSVDTPRRWLVDSAAQAQALAAALNCSGGWFEVEWAGHIAIDESIYVVDGTVLAVTGVEPGAVIDGNGSTRLFVVVNATLHVNGVNITRGASSTGGAIAAAGAILTLNRTTLIENHAAGSAGAVYMSDSSLLSCTDVSFVGNSAGIDGGAVHIARNSSFSCGGSWLSNTAGRYGGALHVDDDSSASWGEEATFTRNWAGSEGGALHGYPFSASSSSDVTTYYACGPDIFGGGGGALAVIARSTVAWSASTTFSGNGAECGGGAMYVADHSNVSWDGEAKSEFDGNEARHGGAVSIADGSHLSSTGDTVTLFTSNVAIVGAGALWLDTGTSVVFDGKTSFDGNTAKGDLSEYESGFGGAVVVDNGSSISWHGDLDFADNSAAMVAGALYVSRSRVSWSGSTEFVGNTAVVLSGAALFMWNGSHVEWTGDTKFTSNEARGDGGAVGCPGFDSNYNFFSSTLVVNGSTVFVNNTSKANGGALALTEAVSVFILDANVSFIENAADVAGGAIHVSGSGIGPVFAGIDFMGNTAQIGGAVSTVGSGNLKGFTDVESPNPTTYDRCVFVGNRATATGGAIESASGQDFFIDSVFEGNKAGAGGALRLAGTSSVENCSFVENGSDDGEGAAVSNIGSISWVTNASFIGNVFYCQPGIFLGYEPGDPYEAVCTGCKTHCYGCLFEAPDLIPICESTKAHSTSSGGNTTLEALSIQAGYWRATASGTNILACYNADACLGGITGSAGYCLEGYEGPYCSVCSDGYTAQLGFTCSKCSDSTGGVMVVVVLAVAAVLVGMAAVVYVMSGEVGCMGRGGAFERLFRNIPLQSVKIVIVAWQILTQFAAVVNVTFPHLYQRFLDALDVFNFDLTWILSAGCIVDVDFHDRLLVSTISPLVALVFMAGTYAAATTFNRGTPDALKVIWNKHVSMALLLTFLVYSSVSAALFQTFACEPLEDGNIYLRADYSIQCDSPKHRAVKVYAGVMMVLYTLGIPTFYGYLLFKDRDVLKNEAERERTPRVTTTSDLWKPYKPSVFYYEVVECVRRISLTGVVVFIEPNTSAQVAGTLMMAFVFVVISEALAPYASRWDAWLSRIGHMVVFVSMYVALLLKVDVSDERAGSQNVFGAILVCGHVCMMSVVVTESIVLTCSMKKVTRWFSPRMLQDHGLNHDTVCRHDVEMSLEEDNPFARHMYKVNVVAMA